MIFAATFCLQMPNLNTLLRVNLDITNITYSDDVCRNLNDNYHHI